MKEVRDIILIFARDDGNAAGFKVIGCTEAKTISKVVLYLVIMIITPDNCHSNLHLNSNLFLMFCTVFLNEIEIDC